MRLLVCLLALALLSPLAWAQGGGASQKPTIAQQMRTSGSASPGYMQGELLKDLQRNLDKQFGADRSGEMMQTLKGQELKSDDIRNLLNGKTTKSGLQDLLGAKRDELDGVQAALGDTVDGKNRKMLFGVIVIVMVVDFDLAADSEFCKQVCGSRDAMSEDDFEKLLNDSR